MESLISIVIYVVILVTVIGYMKKKGTSPFYKKQTGAMDKGKESSSMPHKHRESGVYDTFNRKNKRNDSGAMPHKHEKGHYTSMSDASKLPPGYILLNGEPVRVADLDGK